MKGYKIFVTNDLNQASYWLDEMLELNEISKMGFDLERNPKTLEINCL